MNQQKIRCPNSFKIKLHSSWPIAGVIAWTIAFLFIVTGISYAVTQSVPFNGVISDAQIVKVKPVVKFRQGTKTPIDAAEGNKLSNKNEVLTVRGGNEPFATMTFISGEKQYANLLIKAGPNPKDTQYLFPCQVESIGHLAIGWGAGGDGGCGKGLIISLSSLKKSQLLPASPTILLASKNLQIAQANQPTDGYPPDSDVPSKDYLIVKPVSKLATYAQVEEANSDIQVIAISGNVSIRSPEDAQELLLEEGKQTTYTNGKLSQPEKTDRSICNSSEYKAFINPENWSSAYLSEPVKNGINEHLKHYPAVNACEPPQQPCKISSNVNADIRQLFQLVNEHREANNFPCLQFDDRLASVAQDYADNLADRKISAEEFLSTYKPGENIAVYPDGKTTTTCDRFIKQAYYTETSTELVALTNSPLRAFQLWVQDPYYAILDRSYTRTGISVREDGGRGYYVQTFGQSENTTLDKMKEYCATPTSK